MLRSTITVALAAALLLAGCGREEPPKVAAAPADLVYVTPSGKAYHRKECSTLARSRTVNTVSLDDVGGRRPCSVCMP